MFDLPCLIISLHYLDNILSFQFVLSISNELIKVVLYRLSHKKLHCSVGSVHSILNSLALSQCFWLLSQSYFRRQSTHSDTKWHNKHKVNDTTLALSYRSLILFSGTVCYYKLWTHQIGMTILIINTTECFINAWTALWVAPPDWQLSQSSSRRHAASVILAVRFRHFWNTLYYKRNTLVTDCLESDWRFINVLSLYYKNNFILTKLFILSWIYYNSIITLSLKKCDLLLNCSILLSKILSKD